MYKKVKGYDFHKVISDKLTELILTDDEKVVLFSFKEVEGQRWDK